MASTSRATIPPGERSRGMTKAKTDCFAYKPGQQNPRRKAECTALEKLYCKEGECRFYKSMEDAEGDDYDDNGT